MKRYAACSSGNELFSFQSGPFIAEKLTRLKNTHLFWKFKHDAFLFFNAGSKTIETLCSVSVWKWIVFFSTLVLL